MTDTCGGINLQSTQYIICHIAKVKPATSGHYVADVIPFLVQRALLGWFGGLWHYGNKVSTLKLL